MQTSEQQSRRFRGRLGSCCLQPEQTSLLREGMPSSWACFFRFDDAPMLPSSSPCSELLYNLPSASDGSGPRGLASARPVLPSSQDDWNTDFRLSLLRNGEVFVLYVHAPALPPPCSSHFTLGLSGTAALCLGRAAGGAGQDQSGPGVRGTANDAGELQSHLIAVIWGRGHSQHRLQVEGLQEAAKAAATRSLSCCGFSKLKNCFNNHPQDL